MYHRSHDQGVCIQGGGSASRGGSASGGLPLGGLHPGGLDRPPPHRILQDTVNKRAVLHILLENILVYE